jgi:putative transcriptional regulator
MPSRKGHLLVASASLSDPNFCRTVVLIVKDDDEHGTLGVVLNRRTEATLRDAVEDQVLSTLVSDAPLYKGGPCEAILSIVHTQPDAGDSDVIDGVYFSSHRDSLEQLIGSDEADAAEQRKFFIGYAGWTVGQLSAEIEAGGWLLAPATREQIFDEREDQWNKLITELTLGKWVDVDHMPDDPSMN